MVIDALKLIVKEQSFRPTPLLGLVLNPFYFARKSLNECVKTYAPAFGGKVLDVGCGSKPYRAYFPSGDYVGMEISASSARPEIKADVYYSGDEFPFPEQTFDHVVSFQVLEHVEHPAFLVSEISRVLKKDGTVLLTVPFIWEEHETPYDRTRFTSYGLKELFERHGLEVISFEKLNRGLIAFSQIFTGMVTVAVSERPKIIRYLVQLFFTAPIHFLALVFSIFLPTNDRFYLDNAILARKR